MDNATWLAVAVITVVSISMATIVFKTRAEAPKSPPAREQATCHVEHATAGWRPLVDCPRNCDACLRCLQVDRCVVHRLRELGLTPGTEIRVVQDAGGPMLLSVRGSRIALGRDLARNIWVEVDAPSPLAETFSTV